MDVNVKTIDEEAYDCYLIAIATVLNSMEKDYQMISAGYWGFKYISLDKREDKKIGNGIFPYERRYVEGEKIFYGTELKISYQAGTSQGRRAKESIEALLKERKIVIVVADAYWCSWSTYYKKIHYKHCYLIYGKENENYKCLDPYVNNLFFEETYENMYLDESCKYVLELFSENKNIEREKVLHVLKQDYEYICQSELVENVQRLIHDIDEFFVYEDEIEGDVEQKIISPLIENIRILIRNRQGYLLMLSYLNEIEQFDFKLTTEMAEKCINNWKKLRFLIIKNIYLNKKKNIKELMLNILEDILCSEKSFIDAFHEEIMAYE